MCGTYHPQMVGLFLGYYISDVMKHIYIYTYICMEIDMYILYNIAI
jgi:hypothetical protein